MSHYEVMEISSVRPFVRTHVFNNLQEAAECGRFIAQEAGREVLLRKIEDIAYLSAEKAEAINVDWRTLNAITKTYKVH